MKKYIKNITGDPNGKYPEPQTLAFKEFGKKIILKAQETAETKQWTKDLSHRLILVTDNEIKSADKKKKEVK